MICVYSCCVWLPKWIFPNAREGALASACRVRGHIILRPHSYLFVRTLRLHTYRFVRLVRNITLDVGDILVRCTCGQVASNDRCSSLLCKSFLLRLIGIRFVWRAHHQIKEFPAPERKTHVLLENVQCCDLQKLLGFLEMRFIDLCTTRWLTPFR